jgi:hypothetical protein
MPTHKELPVDRPNEEGFGTRLSPDPAAPTIKFWSTLAGVGALGVVVGTLIWFPLGVCGFLLFLLSLFVLKALRT